MGIISDEIIKNGAAEINMPMIINLLNKALITEYSAFFNYSLLIQSVVGLERVNIEADFKQNLDEELQHIQKLKNRIIQLGGVINLNLDSFKDDIVKYYIVPQSTNSLDSVKTIKKSEEKAIELYNQILRVLGNFDPITTKIIKEILYDEEEHLQEQIDFINDLESFKNKV